MPTSRATVEQQKLILAQLKNPSTLNHGQKVVTTAGTEVPLVGVSTPLVVGVTVKALVGNGDKIYVGLDGVDSTNGFELSPGEQIFIPINDLELVFIDAASDGDGVSFIGN